MFTVNLLFQYIKVNKNSLRYRQLCNKHLEDYLLPYNLENNVTFITTRPSLQCNKIAIKFALSLHNFFKNLVYNASFCQRNILSKTSRCFPDYAVFNLWTFGAELYLLNKSPNFYDFSSLKIVFNFRVYRTWRLNTEWKDLPS